MKNYIVRDVQTGTEIEEFDTLKEAVKCIEAFEKQDRDEEMYEANFYEVFSLSENQTVSTF